MPCRSGGPKSSGATEVMIVVTNEGKQMDAMLKGGRGRGPAWLIYRVGIRHQVRPMG